jgi:hypothetical protein
MLNGSVLLMEGLAIANTPVAGVPSPSFNGGTPASSTGQLVTSLDVPTARIGGLGYTPAGALCIEPAGLIDVYTGGVGVTAAGRLAVDINGIPSVWLDGVPITAQGRVCLASESPPPVVGVTTVTLDFELVPVQPDAEILGYYLPTYGINFGANAWAGDTNVDPPGPGLHVLYRKDDLGPPIEIALGARHTTQRLVFDYWGPTNGITGVYMWQTNGLPNDGNHTGWTFLNTGGQSAVPPSPAGGAWVTGYTGPTFAGSCNAITFDGDANLFSVDNLVLKLLPGSSLFDVHDLDGDGRLDTLLLDSPPVFVTVDDDSINIDLDGDQIADLVIPR